MWEKGSSMAAAVAAGSPDQGLKHDLKIQTWRRMCKLMLLTWRGERAAPCKNAERGRALAPSIISRYGSAHQPCPLDLIAPPLFPLYSCARRCWRGGGGGVCFICGICLSNYLCVEKTPAHWTHPSATRRRESDSTIPVELHRSSCSHR